MSTRRTKERRRYDQLSVWTGLNMEARLLLFINHEWTVHSPFCQSQRLRTQQLCHSAAGAPVLAVWILACCHEAAGHQSARTAPGTQQVWIWHKERRSDAFCMHVLSSAWQVVLQPTETLFWQSHTHLNLRQGVGSVQQAARRQANTAKSCLSTVLSCAAVKLSI